MTYRPHLAKGKSSFVQGLRIGCRYYELRLVDCGKKTCRACNTPDGRHPSHGPYWYMRATRPGSGRKRPSIYLGKELDTARFVMKDGSINWDAVDNKPPPIAPAPAPPDDRQGAPPGDSRGAAHVEKLEQELLQANHAGDATADVQGADAGAARPQRPNLLKRLFRRRNSLT
ncbi:hypothetical protein ES703_114211 [subsurface metagenome]